MFSGRKIGAMVRLPRGLNGRIMSFEGALPTGELYYTAEVGEGGNEDTSILAYCPGSRESREVARGYRLLALHPSGTHFQTTQEGRHYLIDTTSGRVTPDNFLDMLALRLDLRRLYRMYMKDGHVVGVGHGRAPAYQYEVRIGWHATVDGSDAQRVPVYVESEVLYVDHGVAYGVMRPHCDRVALAGLNIDWCGFAWDLNNQAPAVQPITEMKSSGWAWSMPLWNEEEPLCLVHSATLTPALATWNGSEFIVSRHLPGGYIARYSGRHENGTFLCVLNPAERSGEQCFALIRPHSAPKIFSKTEISALPTDHRISFLHLAGEHLVVTTSKKDDEGMGIFLLED